jgi:hypothetical protein
MIDGEFRRKLTDKQRELLGLATEVGLLLVVIAGGTVMYNQRHITHTETTKTVVVAGSPVPGASAMPVPVTTSEMERLTTPFRGTNVTVSLTVSKAWRGTDAKSYSDDALSDTLNDRVANWRFTPEHPERNRLYGPSEAVNYLNISTVDHWLVTGEAPATPANKQAYLVWLGSLKTVTDISAKPCTPITTDTSTCTDAKVLPHVVHTADGALSGLMYLYMQTQSVSYDPTVVVDLTGTVAGKPVRCWGTFQIYDLAYGSLGGSGANTDPNASDYVTKVTAARKAFAGNPPADTVGAYERVLASVQSLRFDAK